MPLPAPTRHSAGSSPVQHFLHLQVLQRQQHLAQPQLQGGFPEGGTLEVNQSFSVNWAWERTSRGQLVITTRSSMYAMPIVGR